MPDIEKVGVVGAGLMGAGIAEVCGRAGLDVLVVETNETALESAKTRIEDSLDRSVRKGKISAATLTTTLSNLDYTDDLALLADRDLVVEAVAENEPAKVGVFRALDGIVERPDVILASNTSSIPIMKLAMATSRPEQVIGIHFFNPVPVLPLVELIPSLLSGEETQDRSRRFVADVLGKTVVLAEDRAGFVVNVLLIPYLLSAVRMLESGFAAAEDIDNGMVHGCAHPMGPLRLADLIGLDTTKAVADSLYEEFKEPLYSPPPLLLRMVDAGLYGRKSGRGFYQYERMS